MRYSSGSLQPAVGSSSACNDRPGRWIWAFVAMATYSEVPWVRPRRLRTPLLNHFGSYCSPWRAPWKRV